MTTSLSIIVPIYNEEGSIDELFKKIYHAMDGNYRKFEIIFINDGSTDGSSQKLHTLASLNKFVKVIHFKRNFGQTAAIMAGIKTATGDILIPMDGDLQNDPLDINRLLKKLDEGYDLVSGWRKDRKDATIMRKIPSKVANWLISIISGVKLHDYGCTLKAYKKEIIKEVKLYGEMHRFIPIYASWQGARVGEIPVNHHPRIHGRSKYGLERTGKIILDLFFIKFMAKYSQKPIHFFGGFGLLNILFSFVCFLLMLYFKFFGEKSFIETPLPMLVILFLLMGFMAIFIGIIAEMIMRIYFETQEKSTYLVDNTFKFKDI